MAKQSDNEVVRWLGHAKRPNPKTPASQALNDATNTETKKPKGGQLRHCWNAYNKTSIKSLSLK